MTALNWRLAALALLLGLALGGRGAWLWQANDYGKQLATKDNEHTAERQAAVVAVLDQLQEQQDQRDALQQRLQTQSQAHYLELKRAQDDRQSLRDRLATADLRLSVLIANPGAAQGGGCGVPTTAGAGGVVYGPVRAELDPAHAQRIIGITGDGDDGLRALGACQGYVRELQKKNMRPSG